VADRAGVGLLIVVGSDFLPHNVGRHYLQVLHRGKITSDKGEVELAQASAESDVAQWIRVDVIRLRAVAASLNARQPSFCVRICA